jgi:hypothetical protein
VIFTTKKTILLSCCVILSAYTQIVAQGLGNAPYSALGIGELYGDGYAPNNAMGGAGVSSGNGFYINSLNPALLVRNRFTTFDVGLLGQYKVLANKTESQREFAGNLGYLALSFPISPKWSAGLSLKPHSFVNYQQNGYSKIGGSIYEAQYKYVGRGGLNTVNLTNGFKIGKSLNVGIETSFIFGGIEKDSETQVKIGDGRDYIVSRIDRVNVSDIMLKVGAAWQHELKKETYLNFGATYNIKNQLGGLKSNTFEIQTASRVPITNADTLLSTTNLGLTIPGGFRVGMSYEKLYNLLISIDYENQGWSKFANSGKGTESAVVYQNQSGVHFGIEYMPRYNSSKYLDLIWYRAGLAYVKTPYIIGGKSIDDISASLGIGLPIGRNFVNLVNLTVVAGQRGDVTDQTFRERYVKISLGLSLKDNWFQKFKVD